MKRKLFMEKERLKFTIERFDHYFDGVNNKSSVILALNTFGIGGLIALFSTIIDLVTYNHWVWVVYGMMIILGLFSICKTLLAFTPFLKAGGRSVLFFASISGTSQKEFIANSSSLSVQDELIDFRVQTHTLAIGLTSKMNNLKHASVLIFIQFLMLIPLLILILTNLK